MSRADIILETIYQYYSTLALEDSVPIDLAELIDNAIAEQMDARVGTAYNLGHDEGWIEGFEEGESEGYMRGFDRGEYRTHEADLIQAEVAMKNLGIDAALAYLKGTP